MKEKIKTIDIHTHGAFGICFDNASQSDYKEYLKNAYETGIEAICPTLTGDTIEKIYEKLCIIKDVKLSQKKSSKETKIIGAHLEGTFLDKNKPGIQNPDVFLDPTKENFKKLVKENEDIVKIVVVGAKDNDNLIKYLKSKDIKVHFGHTAQNNIKGADCITHLFNAMDDISHKKETLSLLGLMNQNIYTELIADTKHVIENVLRLTFKVKDLNKIILISDSIPLAHSDLEYVKFCGKKIYKGGLDDKGTLAGSVMLLPDIVKQLDKLNILPLETAKKLAYDNPINYLKLIV